ncbi:MAG: response regulator [Planctomycetes bacterium]|nr:response regulator [Planctomycetota bacterium]
MFDLITKMFDTSDFPARWNCGNWSTAHGLTHIVADVFTFLAYFAVPLVTIYFVRQRSNLKFPPIFYVFLAMIFLTCGTGHLMEAIIFWWPIYPLAGLNKVATAIVSCIGVVVLARILPFALELKSGQEFQRVLTEREQVLELNKKLERTNEELRRFRDELELRVEQRTRELAVRSGELEVTNRQLQEMGKAERLAKETAEAATRRIGAVLDTAVDAIITIDERGLIESINPATERLFGYSAPELLGQNVNVLMPPPYRDEHDSYLQNYLTTGNKRIIGFGREVTGLRKGGVIFPLELSVSEVILPDRRLFTGFVRDISERKRSEEALHRAKEAAEAANRAKSPFLANMSHEIRTPMNGVLGMTRLTLETELSSLQREYIELAHHSAESLLDIINDILDFSKIEAGKFTLDIVSFSLNDWIQNVLKEIAIRAHAKNLELNADIDPDVPDALLGDPGRLRQVLVKLLGNAVKFTEQGEIELAVRKSAQTGDEIWLEFSVRDTGIGIVPGKLDHMFEPFEQADTSITRKYGGTGLGLTISSRLVSLMGGTLEAQSEVGVGSTFHFRARFHVSDKPAQHRQIGAPAEFFNLNVLVVDDNATNRHILHDTLIHWRMRPTCVASGAEALAAMRDAAAKGSPFALILLDAMMPGMDGFTVAEALRANRAFDSVTIMMLSSAGRTEDVAHCREAGINSYLTKPVSTSKLFNAIIDALDRSHGAQEIAPKGVGALSPPISAMTSAKGSGLRILLAEDNLINQKVMLGALQSVGHQVTIVNNGKEALAILDQQPFDLVLMDLQMPEMDGLQATAAIREMETISERHLPIIALTAHALKEDRARCLAAGMDDYLAKPIQIDELRMIIQSLIPHAYENVQESSPPQSAAATAINRQALLARVGGNAKSLVEILEIVPGQLTNLLKEVEDAIEKRDARRIQLAAHTIKGALGNLSATDGYQAAFRLEDLAKENCLEYVDQAFGELKSQLALILTEVAKTYQELKNS